MRRVWSFLAPVVAWSACGTALGTLVFSPSARLSWRAFISQAVVGFVVSTCCVALVSLAIPALPRSARQRFRYPLNWVLVALSLIALAVAGSAIGVAILVIVQWTEPARAVPLVMAALPTATYFTLLFGMATSFVSESKDRATAEARQLAAEAQLASLESRVNPHFLFNTLNSIAALTHTNPAGAEQMTGQLASLMRSSLDGASTPLVSVREELDLVRKYLDIERVRFGDRLRYTIDVDERAADSAIPRLSLQTLVENSVKYAVSAQREGASIAISAVAHDAFTRVEVQDDGPGFDPGSLSNGHGLELLRARLTMTFERAARLDIQTRPGSTRVAIVVPTSIAIRRREPDAARLHRR
jgi:two-component system, LytTR family, sensor histidine kinase AlgZ